MKVADWEQRLRAVIERNRMRPFLYGSFDCFLFAAEAVHAQTGRDISLGIRGTYTDFESGRAQAGERGFIPYFDRLFNRVSPGFEQPGDLTLIRLDMQHACGITLMDHVITTGERGLISVHKRYIKRAWRVS